MSLTEASLVVTTLVAVATVAAAFIKDRYKPRVDAITTDQVRTQVKKMSDELNAARDIRVLDLERWADKMRPVIWKIKERDDAMCALIRRAYQQLELETPYIPDFPEIPEFPAPRIG